MYQTFRIVCIGGDGVFHEVFNSLLWRQQYEMYGMDARKTNPEPCPIKIGLIPAGISKLTVTLKEMCRFLICACFPYHQCNCLRVKGGLVFFVVNDVFGKEGTKTSFKSNVRASCYLLRCRFESVS